VLIEPRLKHPPCNGSQMTSESNHHPIADRRISRGQTIAERYQIKKRLATGGMATVYLAHDNHLDASVAVKVPDRSLLENKEFRDRFLQETRSLVNLRHPNVLTIIDFGEHDGTPYAVMDYLSGGCVNDQRFRDKQGKFIPVLPAFFDKWLNRISDALDFIHRKGYVHRDIKPDNILFDGEGNAFLSDFGIVKVYEATKIDTSANLTQAGNLIGTPGYMAPEISLGHKYDGRSDQFSLAVLVFELLTGSRPFVGNTPAAIVMQQSRNCIDQLSELQRRWESSVTNVLVRALSSDPSSRFDSCIAFERAITQAFGETRHHQIEQHVVSKCPNCASSIAILPEWVGKIARCNKCSKRIKIQPTGVVSPMSAGSLDPTVSTTPPRQTSTLESSDLPCPSCAALLRVHKDLRGKSVKCMGCQSILRVLADGTRCELE
jgi:serine/threonine protein kinase